MQPLVYTLEVFEGPLDLLLHLIERSKLDIKDIPIALLLEQYLAAIEAAPALDADSMSEFLLMATRLYYIKSRMLLPREEGEEDPRAELVGMLEEYRRCKELAGLLKERYEENGRISRTRRPEPLPESKPVLKPHAPAALTGAYRSIFRTNLRRMPPPIESFTGILVQRAVSVAGKVFSLLRRLVSGRRITVREAVYGQPTKGDALAAFMAVLEIARMDRARLEGEDDEAELWLEGRGGLLER
ncbi:MAG: segregation/condensation protein A [Clostridia bacterium]|nr:segregation/condensation protein A [Clostridia bacterium]